MIATQVVHKSLAKTFCFALVVFCMAPFTIKANGASVLIPVPHRVAHVYDPHRNLLYISTTDGTIERWDVATEQLLSPFAVGLNLSGIDITQDGQFAYVGEATAGATSGFVRKVNLNDGTKTNISYNLSSLERGVHELAITSNGKVFFTTTFAGSGWTPLHELDIASGNLSSRRQVRQSTGIARGFDRSLLFFQESNISSGPISTYDAVTDDFPAHKTTGTFIGGRPAAVNRDGTLIAFLNSFLDTSLTTVEVLPSGAGGYQFDPLRDILYLANTSSETILAYDPNTVALLGEFPIGENIGGGNQMSISDDTRYLFVTTPSGVRMIDNPLAVPEPSSVILLAIGVAVLSVMRARRNRSAR